MARTYKLISTIFIHITSLSYRQSYRESSHANTLILNPKKNLLNYCLKTVLSFLIILPLCLHSQTLSRLNTISELNIGESEQVVLANGETVKLSLRDVSIVRDSVRGAVRNAIVTVEVDGEEIALGSGNYHLPVKVGKVQIDCPVVKEFTVSNYYRHDGTLPKDARLRLWPGNSPYIQPGTFGFPLKQTFMASRTQSQNELAGLGWAENLKSTNTGYHAPHDFGGAEGMDEIFAATDGLVVSSKKEVLEGFEDLPGDVRPDVVWIVDGRGWYYRYSHLNSIEPEINPGAKVNLGQKLGYMGKQGGSGGWVHLHFGVHRKNRETGKWEVEDAFPYLWESYLKEYGLKIKAIARPRSIAWTNQDITLDGSRSVVLKGDIVSYEWIFTDGSKATGPIQKRKYDTAGEYSEILKVTDSSGNVDYDFAYVQVFDRQFPGKQIPTIHPVFYPTMDIKVGDPVTFLVRTFGSKVGKETWDFGDGTDKVVVNSGVVERQTQNDGKYAETVHIFSKPGHYVVRVERTNEFGFPAIGHLFVKVN
ncbi:MAG: PKD domain-containing protein [Bacteroidota bacterium]